MSFNLVKMLVKLSIGHTGISSNISQFHNVFKLKPEFWHLQLFLWKETLESDKEVSIAPGYVKVTPTPQESHLHADHKQANGCLRCQRHDNPAHSQVQEGPERHLPRQMGHQLPGHRQVLRKEVQPAKNANRRYQNENVTLGPCRHSQETLSCVVGSQVQEKERNIARCPDMEFCIIF